MIESLPVEFKICPCLKYFEMMINFLGRISFQVLSNRIVTKYPLIISMFSKEIEELNAFKNWDPKRSNSFDSPSLDDIHFSRKLVEAEVNSPTFTPETRVRKWSLNEPERVSFISKDQSLEPLQTSAPRKILHFHAKDLEDDTDSLEIPHNPDLSDDDSLDRITNAELRSNLERFIEGDEFQNFGVK